MRHLPLVLLVFFTAALYGQGDAGKLRVSTTSHQDTCRLIAEYIGTQKVVEGMICNGKREGLWQVWSASGRLKDSAMYSGGHREDTSSAKHALTGSLSFRGNPKAFYKDSTYECSIQVNAAHAMRDIAWRYEGLADTLYPPLFYFGADMGARDAYKYYFMPKVTGKYRLQISLAGEAGKAMGNASFYEQNIEVKKK